MLAGPGYSPAHIDDNPSNNLLSNMEVQSGGSSLQKGVQTGKGCAGPAKAGRRPVKARCRQAGEGALGAGNWVARA